MKGLIIVLLPVLLAGCMTYKEARVGNQGDTVYAIQRQQLADPERAASPGTAISPTGIDGFHVEGVLESYRGSKGDASQVAQPIQINVGN